MQATGDATTPTTEADPTQRVAEYLRLTLPLMARHRVPATPHNYAVWYTHVAGENSDLSDALERMIAERAVFDTEQNQRLYKQFIADYDLNHIEQVRGSLSDIIEDLGSSLTKADDDTRNFEGTLGGFVNELQVANDLPAIRQLLESLVTETRAMRITTSEIQSQVDSRSKEIEELQRQLQIERKRAITDPLTGLYNRIALLDYLQAAILEMGNSPPPSLVMIDIDHFKAINDTHGHLIGDRVIRFVAQMLQRNIKGRDTAARYGGEEFILLLPATGSQGALAVTESVLTAVSAAQLVRADTKQPLGKITLSAGIATYQPGEDAMSLINRADGALYQAKNAGRNQIVLA